MAKFLFTANYTTQRTDGLLKEGAAARCEQITKAVKSLGGKLEVIYYAFGDFDVLLIVDFPDASSAAAFSLNANKTGAMRLKTTPLLTVGEIDEAATKTVRYRPPGA